MPRNTVERPSGFVPGYLPVVTFLILLTVGGWYSLRPTPELPPGRVELGRLSHRNAFEAVSFNGIAGGARAAHAELAKRSAGNPEVQVSAATAYGMSPLPGLSLAPTDPNQLTPAIRLSGIVSEQPSDRASAKADALRQARARLADVFASLRAPIAELPDEETFEREFVPSESVLERKPTEAEKAAWRAEKLDENRVWMSVSVSVSEDQLRQLRARQRLSEMSRWAAVALVVLAVGYGVLRTTGGAGWRRLVLVWLGAALAAFGVAKFALDP